jgi:uncharacterized membrane protein (UPF0127 family)
VGALITLATIAIGILVLIATTNGAHGAESVASAKKQVLIVARTPAGGEARHRTFDIALVCDTDATRVKGLQGFRKLKNDEVALFDFQTPAPVTFWMGAVAYPIDIIFINSDMRVFKVYANCQPDSREVFPSRDPVRWVIETAAGSGIAVGDRVSIR